MKLIKIISLAKKLTSQKKGEIREILLSNLKDEGVVNALMNSGIIVSKSAAKALSISDIEILEVDDLPRSIERDSDGKLKYSAESITHCLRKLVYETGGSADYLYSRKALKLEEATLLNSGELSFEQESRLDEVDSILSGEKYDNKKILLVKSAEVDRGPEHLYIPSVEDVVRTSKDGEVTLKDNILSGLVEGEESTLVDSRQYTCLQADLVEENSLKHLQNGLNHLGLSEGQDIVKLRDIAVYKPERMAMQSIAILTRMFVKTTQQLPENEELDTRHFDDFMERRNDEYQSQVDDIYFNLFGINRSTDKLNGIERDEPWEGYQGRRGEINSLCENLKAEVCAEIDQYLAGEENSLNAEDKTKLEEVIANSERRNNWSRDEVIDNLGDFIKGNIYRDKAYDLMNDKMGGYFSEVVFEKGDYQKKKFLPAEERKSIMTFGGSATGKSQPNAMILKGMYEGRTSINGQDSVNISEWEKNGLKAGEPDINDVVWFGSEEMRGLLTEEESLEYGNRLHLDSWGHPERSRIRIETFKYMDKVMSGEVTHDLVEAETAPIITHDRRSMPKRQLEVVKKDGATTICYYFNVPVAEALRRNRFRGSAMLKEAYENGVEGADLNELIDPETFKTRFVNAMANIGSHDVASERLLELLETEKGENLVIMGYSTDVDFKDAPFIFLQADMYEGEIDVRRFTRMLAVLAAGSTEIPVELEKEAKPIGITLNEMVLGEDLIDDRATSEALLDKQIEHSEQVAERLAKIVKANGSSVTIYTPLREKGGKDNEVGAPNIPFVKLSMDEDELVMGILKPQTYKEKLEGRRYGALLDKLNELSGEVKIHEQRRVDRYTLASAEVSPISVAQRVDVRELGE